MSSIASLIETAKMKHIESFAYLNAALKAIAAEHPASANRSAPAPGLLHYVTLKSTWSAVSLTRHRRLIDDI